MLMMCGFYIMVRTEKPAPYCNTVPGNIFICSDEAHRTFLLHAFHGNVAERRPPSTLQTLPVITGASCIIA